MVFIVKYRILAEQIIADINNGRLNVNDKFPSLTATSTPHRVSMAIAITCYQFLEAEGYAVAKTKKGYFGTD